MSTRPVAQAFCSGVLLANAAPHAYAASVGANQLTPLAGRRSGPRTNAVWSAINVGAGLAAAWTLDPGDAAQRGPSRPVWRSSRRGRC
ncbi:hypothetical protein ACQP1U_12305 [Actinomycetota bacterium]